MATSSSSLNSSPYQLPLLVSPLLVSPLPPEPSPCDISLKAVEGPHLPAPTGRLAGHSAAPRLLYLQSFKFPAHVHFPQLPSFSARDFQSIFASSKRFIGTGDEIARAYNRHGQESVVFADCASEEMAKQNQKKQRALEKAIFTADVHAFDLEAGKANMLAQRILQKIDALNFEDLEKMASMPSRTPLITPCQGPAPRVEEPDFDPVAMEFLKNFKKPLKLVPLCNSSKSPFIISHKWSFMQVSADSPGLAPNIIGALDIMCEAPFDAIKHIPQALLIALDVSSSMDSGSHLKSRASPRPSVLSQAVRGITNQIAKLRADDYFGLITFSNEPKVLIPIQRVGEHKDALIKQMHSISTKGSTSIMDAVNSLMIGSLYFFKQQETTINPNILLITDCEDSTVKPEALANLRFAMEKIAKSDVDNYRLNIIALSVPEAYQKTLQMISTKTGGRVYAAARHEEIGELIAEAFMHNTLTALKFNACILNVDGPYSFNNVMHEGPSPALISDDGKQVKGLQLGSILRSTHGQRFPRTLIFKLICNALKPTPFNLKAELCGQDVAFDLPIGLTLSTRITDVKETCNEEIEKMLRYGHYRAYKAMAIGLVCYDPQNEVESKSVHEVNSGLDLAAWTGYAERISAVVQNMQSFSPCLRPTDAVFASSLVQSIDFLKEFQFKISFKYALETTLEEIQQMGDVKLAIANVRQLLEKLGPQSAPTEERLHILNSMLSDTLEGVDSQISMLQHWHESKVAHCASEEAMQNLRNDICRTTVGSYHPSLISMCSQALIEVAKKAADLNCFVVVSPDVAENLVLHVSSVSLAEKRPFITKTGIFAQLERSTQLMEPLIANICDYLDDFFLVAVRFSTNEFNVTFTYPQFHKNRLEARLFPAEIDLSQLGWIIPKNAPEGLDKPSYPIEELICLMREYARKQIENLNKSRQPTAKEGEDVPGGRKRKQRANT